MCDALSEGRNDNYRYEICEYHGEYDVGLLILVVGRLDTR